MTREELLKEIKCRLTTIHGERLRGAVLYGSEARGTAEPDSDIDVLVLLEGPVAFGHDLETNLEAAGATTSSRVLRPHHVMRQTDLAPSGKFHFYFLYFAIYSDYYRFRLLLQLTFYFISYILFSDDAFQ